MKPVMHSRLLTASALMIMEVLEAEKHRSSSLNKSTVPSFDNVVLFRCSRSGSLMFNAFFFEISMECLVQEFRASVSTDNLELMKLFLEEILCRDQITISITKIWSKLIISKLRQSPEFSPQNYTNSLRFSRELRTMETLDNLDPKEFDIFEDISYLETMSIGGTILVDSSSFLILGIHIF
ncbi:hypothetical protein Tco_0202007 [Tanacetum coccineum]